MVGMAAGFKTDDGTIVANAIRHIISGQRKLGAGVRVRTASSVRGVQEGALPHQCS